MSSYPFAERSTGGRRRRRGLLLLSAVAALVGLALWLSRGARRSDPPVSAQTDATLATPVASRPLEPRARPSAPAEDHVPIIDEITVEKPEVCIGEENLITVRAHAPNRHEDAFLHYSIDGVPGRAVPVRTFLDAEGQPLFPQAHAFGHDNAAAFAAVPPYRVKYCAGQRLLQIDLRAVPNAPEERELVATTRDLDTRAELHPVEYRWDFGDGSSATTKVPVASHQFAVPAGGEESGYWQYLARCQAIMKDGRDVVGRLAVQIVNQEFESLEHKKLLVLSAELTPRFPELDGEGRVTQRVRLYHHRKSPVTLRTAHISYVTANGTSGPTDRELPAASLLGTETVPPGFGVEVSLTFDARAYDNVLIVDYVLEGTTADGSNAMARFSLMRPPPLPVPGRGDRVADPALVARIVRAREKLGKTFVNDEDLLALERAGSFDDLPARADPRAQVATQSAPPGSAGWSPRTPAP